MKMNVLRFVFLLLGINTVTGQNSTDPLNGGNNSTPGAQVPSSRTSAVLPTGTSMVIKPPDFPIDVNGRSLEQKLREALDAMKKSNNTDRMAEVKTGNVQNPPAITGKLSQQIQDARIDTNLTLDTGTLESSEKTVKYNTDDVLATGNKSSNDVSLSNASDAINDISSSTDVSTMAENTTVHQNVTLTKSDLEVTTISEEKQILDGDKIKPDGVATQSDTTPSASLETTAMAKESPKMNNRVTNNSTDEAGNSTSQSEVFIPMSSSESTVEFSSSTHLTANLSSATATEASSSLSSTSASSPSVSAVGASTILSSTTHSWSSTSSTTGSFEISTASPTTTVKGFTDSSSTVGLTSSTGVPVTTSMVSAGTQSSCLSLSCNDNCPLGYQFGVDGCPTCSCRVHQCQTGQLITGQTATLCNLATGLCPQGQICERSGSGSIGVCCPSPFSADCPTAQPGSRLLCLVQQRYQCRTDRDCAPGQSCCPSTCGNTCRRLTTRRSRLLVIV